MKLLISLPVYKRSWILPLWFSLIEKQEGLSMSDVGFSFQLAPYEEDKETHDVLFDWFSSNPKVSSFVLNTISDIPHRHHDDGHRYWDGKEYNKMTLMRNALLDTANALEPDFLFSLDSDILLENPDSINRLISYCKPGTAVSPLMFMTHHGVNYPSVMSWVDKPGGRAFRDLNNYKLGTIFKADIIMAAVMMSPEAYNKTRYQHHHQGEDLGWSFSCYQNNIDLYSVSNLYCPHIMHKSSSSVKGKTGPGVMDIYLAHGDDRIYCSVNKESLDDTILDSI